LCGVGESEGVNGQKLPPSGKEVFLDLGAVFLYFMGINDNFGGESAGMRRIG
jgi:hypothetical protein